MYVWGVLCVSCVTMNFGISLNYKNFNIIFYNPFLLINFIIYIVQCNNEFHKKIFIQSSSFSP
jgi:hypothetical protein